MGFCYAKTNHLASSLLNMFGGPVGKEEGPPPIRPPPPPRSQTARRHRAACV